MFKLSTRQHKNADNERKPNRSQSGFGQKLISFWKLISFLMRFLISLTPAHNLSNLEGNLQVSIPRNHQLVGLLPFSGVYNKLSENHSSPSAVQILQGKFGS